MKALDKPPVRCPKCSSADVRLSYTQSLWDAILDLLFSMDAYRCRACRTRFHHFDTGADEDEILEAEKQAAAGR